MTHAHLTATTTDLAIQMAPSHLHAARNTRYVPPAAPRVTGNDQYRSADPVLIQTPDHHAVHSPGPDRALVRPRYRNPVTVYAIAQLTIHDRARYQRYVDAFMPILIKHGGGCWQQTSTPR